MKKATIYIYDSIGQGTLTAKDFNASLQDLENQGVEEFEIHINSYGGDVFEGMAIYNLLKSRNVTTYVDGLAASIASVIALAGKKVVMYKNTMIMIHNVWVLAAGDGDEMQKQSDRLKQINDLIVKIYMDKTGLKKDEVEALMKAETFLNAKDAKGKGFIDEIQDSAKFQNTKDYVGYYVNIYDDSKNKNEEAMNKLLLKFLGLAENATDQQITDKLTQIKNELKLDENATLETIVAAMKAKDTGDGKPAAGAVAETELEKTVNELKTKFATLETASASDKAESLVQGAIDDGKILPADKKVWINNALTDYAGTKTSLDAKAKNSAVPGKVEVKEVPEGTKPDSSTLVKNAADFIKQARAEKK